MFRVCLYHALVLTSAILISEKVAYANESTNYLGMTGLNTVPTARMDEAGTIRAGLSHADPHNHAFMGFQIAKPLYINLRQSLYLSSIGDKPENVYPGMDFKLRLKKEGRYMPEIVFGMDSALGHKRFSSEYFALSKRIYDFDFTAGVAWGRLGSSGHLKNPFANLSSHFENERDFRDEDSASPSDWFTGKEIGFFGGVEYFTALKGLSLKADFNADAYNAENQYFGFKKPSPWSIGVNYSPKDWVSVGVSAIGLDKVMARLSFQSNIFNWNTKSYKDKEGFKFDSKRPEKTWRHLPRDMAQAEQINLGKTRVSEHDFSAVLHLNDYQPSTLQIGRAARHLAASAGTEIETITIIPVIAGIRAKTVTFSRRDLEQSIARNLGSPEEIWQDVSFGDDKRSISQKNLSVKYKLIPELSFSLGEEETSHLYRTALTVERLKEWQHGFHSGTSLKLNVADNLHRLAKFRQINLESVRSDADLFTVNRVNLERGYGGWMKTIIPDFHLAITAGYLEEMYAGYGGEVLYRPFDSPFSIGAEAWQVYKRDGLSPMALYLTGESAFTGHLNLNYDIPNTDITAFAKVGQFIGGDVGVMGGAQMQFANGIKAKAFMTVSDSDDKDVFRSDRNIQGGFQLAVPLGNLKFIPQGSHVRTNIAPIGRNDGALLDKPISLYEVTEPMSYRHLGRSWQEVLN